MALVAASCRRTESTRAPEAERIASLEQGLDGQRNTESYLIEVSSWTAHLTETVGADDRDMAEETARSLNDQVLKVRQLVDRARSDRFSGWNPALASAARELNALRDAHYRALAALPSARREAERAMGEKLDALSESLAGFRVEASSFNVASNGELKRRSAALDISRREAAEVLKEIQRSSEQNWPYLRRRWDRQVAMWESDHRTALERLGVIAESTGTFKKSQS